MRKLFALIAIAGLAVSVVGCEQKKAAPTKPAGGADAPAATPAEPAK